MHGSDGPSASRAHCCRFFVAVTYIVVPKSHLNPKRIRRSPWRHHLVDKWHLARFPLWICYKESMFQHQCLLPIHFLNELRCAAVLAPLLCSSFPFSSPSSSSSLCCMLKMTVTASVESKIQEISFTEEELEAAEILMQFSDSKFMLCWGKKKKRTRVIWSTFINNRLKTDVESPVTPPSFSTSDTDSKSKQSRITRVFKKKVISFIYLSLVVSCSSFFISHLHCITLCFRILLIFLAEPQGTQGDRIWITYDTTTTKTCESFFYFIVLLLLLLLLYESRSLAIHHNLCIFYYIFILFDIFEYC